MKLPSKLAGSLGVAITSLLVLAQETHWSHEVKQAVIIAGGLLLAWFVHPQEGAAPEVITRPPTAAKPDGVAPAPPPGI
jgi:hypothetical protein